MVVKLYIGGLPSSTDESIVADMLGKYGPVESISISRSEDDHRLCRGFAFAKMTHEDDAKVAIGELHNIHVVDEESSLGPVQIQIVDDVPVSGDTGHVDDSMSEPVKLFVGGIPGNASGKTIRSVFSPFGPILDMFISPEKGYGFVKFPNRECAINAISALTGSKLPGVFAPWRFVSQTLIVGRRVFPTCPLRRHLHLAGQSPEPWGHGQSTLTRTGLRITTTRTPIKQRGTLLMILLNSQRRILNMSLPPPPSPGRPRGGTPRAVSLKRVQPGRMSLFMDFQRDGMSAIYTMNSFRLVKLFPQKSSKTEKLDEAADLGLSHSEPRHPRRALWRLWTDKHCREGNG